MRPREVEDLGEADVDDAGDELLDVGLLRRSASRAEWRRWERRAKRAGIGASRRPGISKTHAPRGGEGEAA